MVLRLNTYINREPERRDLFTKKPKNSTAARACCSVLEVFAAADVLCAHMCVARGAV